MKDIEFKKDKLFLIIEFFIEKYGGNYKNLLHKKENIKKGILDEIEKFEKTLKKGMKEFERIIDPENKKIILKKLILEKYIWIF